MNKKLLILGAGQYSFVAKDIADELGIYETVSFLDDNSETAIGKLWDFSVFSSDYHYAFVAIGNAELRLELIDKLALSGFSVVSLISPKAFVSPSSHIGCGVAIEPLTAVQANTVIGNGSFISSGAVIRHNAVMGKGCHADCCCVVPSNVIVPDKTKIACGSVFGIN